jgi:hypothetical protein
MDEPRLDQIARAMASGVTRRRLVRGLGTGLAGAALAVHQRQEAAAQIIVCPAFDLEECLGCCDNPEFTQPGKQRGQCIGRCHKRFAPGQVKKRAGESGR